MAQSTTETDRSLTVTRATIQSYLIGLVGVMFVVANVRPALDAGFVSPSTGALALGLFAIGGGVATALQPARIRRGEEPAPGYQYVLAAIATVAMAAFLLA